MPKFKDPRALAAYQQFQHNSFLTEPSIPNNGLEELALSVSQGCNLGCSYCFADKGQYGSNKQAFMTFEIARQAIDAFIIKYNGDVKSIKFFGGEPLLNFSVIKQVCRYFDDLFKIGKVSRIPTYVVITNLTFLTDEMLRHFSNYKFLITVSLDGPKEINDSFRKFDNRTGSFDIVDTNIPKLKKVIEDNLRIEATYNPQHLIANISMVDLYNFFVERYGVYNIIMHPLAENSFFKMVFSTLPENIVNQFRTTMFDMSCSYGKHLINMVSEGKQIIEVFKFISDMSAETHTDNHCGLGVNRVNLNSDGAITPCYTLTNQKEFDMGNVVDGQKEIFSTKYSNVQLKFLDNRKSNNPICAQCDILSTCQACPGLMYQQHENINAVIPLMCDYYVGIKEGMLLQLNEISSDPLRWKTFLKTLSEVSQIINSHFEVCD